ncbi:MAG: hypothetical protein NZ853_00690 [Leptospiraceae bacterium]|nr:hypothetical protein [Leptospiraceae bacterium]MDW7976255.1 hypothetical protein [Leptospiraceae bacterium]
MHDLIIATITLSLLHGSIPNHWLPFVVLSKNANLNYKRFILIVSLGSFFHSFSTSLLGFFLSYLGYHSSQVEYLERLLPSFFLILLGMIYLTIKHDSLHQEINTEENIQKNRSLAISLFLIYLAMFFSPCLEIEAIFFSAGRFGFESAILIAIIYSALTLISMLTFSFVSYMGLLKYYPKFLQIYEKKISGIILILLGIFHYFYSHSNH